MRLRRLIAGVVAGTGGVLLAATVLAAAPAAAGGWAVTTLDPLGTAPVAGRPFTVGYTIRQHGQTPIAVDDSAIVVIPADGGPPLRFPGHPDGVVGHHVADVTFPAAGSVQWRVDQGAFGAQDLGPITVGTGTAPDLARSGDAGTTSAARWAARGGALALTVAAGAATVAALVGRRRARPAPTAPAAPAA